MNPFSVLKKIWKNSDVSKQFLAEIREGIANHAELTNRKLNEFIGRQSEMIELLKAQIEKSNLEPYNVQSAAGAVDRVINEAMQPFHRSIFWGDRLLTIDKSAGFLSDPQFKSAFDTIRGSHTYDQYASPHTISWRLHTLVWAAKSSLHVEGDFVECGVFKGDMSWIITQTVDFAAVNKQFYLYDTFEGFSEKYSSVEDFPENPSFMDFANAFYKNPEIYPYVCKRFAQRSDVKVIKGVVPDALLDVAPQKIAFLHIDLNSPAAEIGALEILFPRLTPGGVLVFDDYGWKQCHKQKEAEDLFMQKHGHEILELPTGQGLVIKK